MSQPVISRNGYKVKIQSEQRPYQIDLPTAQELVHNLIVTVEDIEGAYHQPGLPEVPASTTIRISPQRAVYISPGDRLITINHAPVLNVPADKTHQLIEGLVTAIEITEDRAESLGIDPYLP